MLKKIVLAVMAVSFATSIYAAKITEGFEDKTVLKKWEIEGDVTISTDQKHGGNSSLFTPFGSTATFRFSTENKFGTVTMWVYDSFAVKKAPSGSNGPYFGLINSDDDKAVEVICYRPYLTINDYSEMFTAEAQWFSPWHSAISRPKAAWGKWLFTFTDDKTLGATFNDEKESAAFSTKLEFFKKGANGIVLSGGPSLGAKNETFYFDDIEIDVKDTAKEAPKPVK